MKNRNGSPVVEEAGRKDACDKLITGAARIMVHEIGAPVDEMLDRLLTYVAAQACASHGSEAAAATFRIMADRIEGGLFGALEPRRNVQ